MNLPEPHLPRGPIVKSFRDQIAQSHEAGKQADTLLRDALLAKLNVTRETGILLRSARESLGKNEFATATDFLGEEAVQTYLKFVRACPDEISDIATGLREVTIAMMATQALPFPHFDGAQILHKLNFLSEATKTIQKFASNWSKFVRRKPLKEWQPHQLDSFIAALSPILRIYKTLAQEVQRRASHK